MSNYIDNIEDEDIIDYLPIIKNYVNYDLNNNYFDLYKQKTYKFLKLDLSNHGININDNKYTENELLKQLFISYLVYQVYLLNSNRVEEDRFFIKELEKDYKALFNNFIEKEKKNAMIYEAYLNYIG